MPPLFGGTEPSSLLVAGARLNWMFGFGRQFAPDAKIIQIDIEPEEIGANRPVEVGIIGDAKAAQDMLVRLEAGGMLSLTRRIATAYGERDIRSERERPAGRELRQHCRNESRPVLPVAQRRQLQRQAVEPVVQVFTEA